MEVISLRKLDKICRKLFLLLVCIGIIYTIQVKVRSLPLAEQKRSFKFTTAQHGDYKDGLDYSRGFASFLFCNSFLTRRTDKISPRSAYSEQYKNIN